MSSVRFVTWHLSIKIYKSNAPLTIFFFKWVTRWCMFMKMRPDNNPGSIFPLYFPFRLFVIPPSPHHHNTICSTATGSSRFTALRCARHTNMCGSAAVTQDGNSSQIICCQGPRGAPGETPSVHGVDTERWSEEKS